MSRMANAARALRGAPPKPGRVVVVAPTDAVGGLLTGDLTPERAVSILRSAASGDPSQQNDLFDEMLERDGHLASVYHTRRYGLTGLNTEIVAATEAGKNPRIDEKLADDAAEYCREVLGELEGWEPGLCHLAEAIGRGTSVVELMWDIVDGVRRPVAMEPVPFTVLGADAQDLRRLVIRTAGNWKGLAVDEFAAGKFIVHTPHALGGGLYRGGLLRGAVLGYMCKKYGRRWWMVGIELYGMPTVIVKYDATADADAKEEMLKMIRELGVARGGVFPMGSETELLERSESGSGEWPHERLIKYFDAEFSKEFLGQTLTTEIGQTGGANAAAQVHDEVREDLRDDDIHKEAATLREQLLVPMVVYRFGPDAAGAAPYFRRVIEEPKDLSAMAQLVSVAVNDLGAKVPVSFVRDELGLPIVETEQDPDTPLPGRSSGGGDFLGLPQSRLRPEHHNCGGHADWTAHRVLTDIVRGKKTAIGKTAAWIIAAVIASTAHTQNVIGQMQAWLEKRRSLDAALAELPSLFDDLPIDDLVELERQFLLAGQLAGRAHARGQVQAHSARRIAHAEVLDVPRLPFIQAIEALRDRIGLDPETFLELEAAARSRAWRVAGIWDMDMLAVLHTNLVQAIANGETSRDFRLRVPAMMETRGWFGENPWHADLVHYQNFAMAHAAGRLGEYQDFGVEHWRYVSWGEASCPICAPQVGKVFDMNDRRFFPPLHFWCDCQDEPVFEGELEGGQITDSADITNPAFDAEQEARSGFKWDPAEYGNLNPLDVSRFPEDLRPAFRQFGERLNWEIVG